MSCAWYLDFTTLNYKFKATPIIIYIYTYEQFHSPWDVKNPKVNEN